MSFSTAESTEVTGTRPFGGRAAPGVPVTRMPMPRRRDVSATAARRSGSEMWPPPGPVLPRNVSAVGNGTSSARKLRFHPTAHQSRAK